MKYPRNMTGPSLLAKFILSVNVCMAAETKENVTDSPNCHCSWRKEMLTADCRAKNLTHIPACVPDYVNVLLLSENDIRHINNTTFSRFTNLTKLDMSQNDIDNIDQSAFDGLDKLEFLNISACFPLYTPVISSSLFKPLKKLRSLFMNRMDRITGFMEKYPASALKQLVTLETIFIDGLFNSSLDFFAKLRVLKHVSFSGYNGFCNISIINAGTFSSLSHIEILNISSCNLYEIHPDTFWPLLNLTTLDLSQNPCLNIKGVENATHGLQNSQNIQKLYFNDVVDALATCVQVGDTLFENIQNTSVREIHFDRNRIETFSNTSFEKSPPSLSMVSLRSNRFTYGSYAFHIADLKGLEDLDLSGELNYPIVPDFKHKICQASHVVPNTCGCSYNSGDDLDLIKQVLGFTGNITIPLPPKLVHLSLRYRNLPYNIENLQFQENSLKSLDLSYNILTSWRGYVHGLEGLEHIDVSHSNVHFIYPNFLKHFPSLKTLNVSKNVLHNVLENDTKGVVLRGLINLTELNLAHNILHKLPVRVFEGLRSLQVLNLSHNYLREFSSNIIHMHDLHTVDCTYNEIRSMKLPIRQQFDQLAEKHNVTLKLAYNSFECTCENLIFLSWLEDSKILVEHGGNFYCSDSSGEFLHYLHLKNILEPLQNECHNHLSLYIGTTSATMMILILAFLSVGYRYRWKLRYWYYAARLRYSATPNKHSDNFEFDAFVSFADEDREFVISELLEKFENEADLRLNIHQRNFTAGRPIASNIIEAVKNSRKTLLILSEHFIQSYWCIYELQMANMESVITGRDVILILRLGDVPVKDIPPEILYHFQTDSYLDYPQNEDVSLFWRTLADSISI